jgi:hypothetical protein
MEGSRLPAETAEGARLAVTNGEVVSYDGLACEQAGCRDAVPIALPYLDDHLRAAREGSSSHRPFRQALLSKRLIL